MSEPGRERDPVFLIRKWGPVAAVVGTGLWVSFFFAFLVYHSVVGSIPSGNWFLKMVHDHPGGTIGIAMSAISAYCLVAILEISSGAIEFEVLGFKFKGASGPVILWVLCFLAMVFAVWLLWGSAK